ncbi:hypothetical protein [Megasphaera sueciensis]|uniref:hypothetical protein n=1 Tax=Megasphaera sueciensis TaxID=349094 RepID=UPI003CFC94A1
MIREIVINIKKKWLIICACAVVCSCLLMGEKLVFNQYVVQSGNVHFETIVEVDNHKKNSVPFYENRIKYDKFFQTYAFMNSFIRDTEQKIDYNKLNTNWNKMSQDEKLKWMQKKLIVNDFNDGVFQIVFYLDITDSKDMDYIKTNAELLPKIILGEFSKQINLIDANDKLKIVNETQLFPEVQPVSKGKIVVNYGILGGILGIIIGMITVTVNTLCVLGKKK